MTNITGFTNSKCTMGAFTNLEMFRKPSQNPMLDKMRLLTFIPDAYALPKQTKETIEDFNRILGETYVQPSFRDKSHQGFDIINSLGKMNRIHQFVSEPKNQRNIRQYQQIINEPRTQMASKMHARAIDEVYKGRAVPFYAGYFDALKKPEQKVEQVVEHKSQPKSKYVSISERLAKRYEKNNKKNVQKASKRTMKLYKKQNNSKISVAEINKMELNKNVYAPKTAIFKQIGLQVKSVARLILSKAAIII